MLSFNKIVLKPMSWQVLQNICDGPERTSEQIAESVGLTKRQVDAVVTRTLVRLGFCIRYAKISRLMKKEYSLIKITQDGEDYVSWRRNQNK